MEKLLEEEKMETKTESVAQSIVADRTAKESEVTAAEKKVRFS